MCRWYERCSNPGIVVYDAVNLLRNVSGMPFEERMSGEQKKQLLKMVEEAFDGTVFEKKKDAAIDCGGEDETAFNIVQEQGIVDTSFGGSGGFGRIFLSEDDMLSLQVNGREQLLLRSVRAGSSLPEVFEQVMAADRALNRSLSYAFSSRYGYLTASPFCLGTGLIVKRVLQLSALQTTGTLKDVSNNLAKCGYNLKSVYGDGDISYCGFYELSNIKTLGLSETEILSGIEQMTGQLVNQEKRTRQQMISQNRIELTDTCCRAYGILKYARTLSLKEALNYLSIVRMGENLQLITGSGEENNIFSLMMHCQPGMICRAAGEELTEAEIGCARAAYIRENIREINL